MRGLTQHEKQEAALAALKRANAAGTKALRLLQKARGRAFTPAEQRRYQQLVEEERGAIATYERLSRPPRWRVYAGRALALAWVALGVYVVILMV